MARVTTDAMLIGFAAKWTGTSAITTVVTGGLHFSRAGAETLLPHAVMKCVEEESERTPASWVQKFLVTVDLYAENKPDDTTTATAEAAIKAAFDFNSSLPSVTGGTVVGVEPVVVNQDYDEERDVAAEVSKVAMGWRFYIYAAA